MYPGENINSLNLDLLNFDDVFVVVTDKPDDLNGCGHIGLKIGVKGTDKDYFIHVPGPHQIGDRFSENLKRFYGLYITPQYMPYLEYQNYFTSNGYKVVSKDKIPLDSKGRKAKIKAKLESFQDKPKTYGFIVKNCMTFVREVLESAGITVHSNFERWNTYLPLNIECPISDWSMKSPKHLLNLQGVSGS